MNNHVLFGDVVQDLVWLCIVAIIITLLFLRIFIKNNNGQKNAKWQNKLLANYFKFLFIWIFTFIVYAPMLGKVESWINYVVLIALVLVGNYLARSTRK